MVRVRHMGRDIEGDEVRFRPKEEAWSVYELADGHELRMKLIVSQVIRIPGAIDDQGHPVYVVRHSPSIMVAASGVSMETPVVDVERDDFKITDLDENVERQIAEVLES